MRPPGMAAVVLPLLVCSFIGCSRKEIVIGGLAALSGDAAATGIPSQRGFEMAFAECNAAGGIKGHPVKLVVADNKSDDLGCTTAALHLVKQDKVVAILGPNRSWQAKSGGRICQQAQVPMVATTATDPSVTQVGDYIFRACYTDNQQGEAGAQFAFEHLRARTAACIFVKFFIATPHQTAAESFSARFAFLGGKVATESFGANGKDSSQVLDSLLAARPDLLYAAVPEDHAGQITRQAREKGFKGPILGTDYWDDAQVIAQAGPAMEGAYFTSHFSAGDTRPEVQDFVKKFIGRFGVEPDLNAALAYDASRLLFDSLRRAGSTAGPAVRDALKTADFPGISGRVKFDESRNPLKPIEIIQVRSGKPAYDSTLNP